MKPKFFKEAKYPTKGISTDIIIILELKNEVEVPISSGLKVVFAICRPKVQAIPSGIAVIKNARMKKKIETKLSARKIAEISAILTANIIYGLLFIIGDFKRIMNLVKTSLTNIAANK